MISRGVRHSEMNGMATSAPANPMHDWVSMAANTMVAKRMLSVMGLDAGRQQTHSDEPIR